MNLQHIADFSDIIGQSLVKIAAAGFKTKLLYKTYKAFNIRNKLKKAEEEDALNMYPGIPVKQKAKKKR